MSSPMALRNALRDRVAKLRVLGGLLGDNHGRVAALAISSVLSGLTEAGILAIVAQVAANLATGGSRIDAHLGPVVMHAAPMTLLAAATALALLRLALQLPISYVPARIASDVQAKSRGRLFDAFTRASWATQASDREGYLQELMGTDVMQVSGGAVQATMLLTSLAASAVLVASSFALNAMGAAIVVTVSIGVLVLLRPLSAASARYGQAWARGQVDHASAVSEASRLAEETHVFGVGSAQRERLAAFIERVRAPYFRTQMIIRVIPNLYQNLIYLLLVGGLAALHEFTHGSIASLGAVVLLLVRAAGYGNAAQGAYEAAKQALPFVERVRKAEARYAASAPSRGSRPLREIERLEFVDVCFSYGAGRAALDAISFTIRDGETIGIAGPSGAGKSTLAQLLLQLRDPTSGHYLVNGEPAHEFRVEDWHAKVAYVPQTAHLIHASVGENIRYLRNFSQEEVEHAAKLAGIHDEVMTWEASYATVVGPRADAVSGGQAQRICLARALVGRPKVLLLDEPTSAVDVNSERLIQESLMALKGEVTLLVIAHRVSTLDMCDRVMIILDGKLNAFEPFARLRRENAYYRSVAGTAEREPPASLVGP